jgi:hypothetical protein
MRFFKVLGVFLLVCCAVAIASENKMGIHEVSRITFSEPVRVGSDVLPKGEYIVRHSMQGEEHIMAFERVGSHKEAVRVKCTLVPLGAKADKDQVVYEVVSGKEKVLHEMIVRGDTAKHVF